MFTNTTPSTTAQPGVAALSTAVSDVSTPQQTSPTQIALATQPDVQVKYRSSVVDGLTLSHHVEGPVSKPIIHVC